MGHTAQEEVYLICIRKRVITIKTGKTWYNWLRCNAISAVVDDNCAQRVQTLDIGTSVCFHALEVAALTFESQPYAVKHQTIVFARHRKKIPRFSPTFPDETASNMSNKCTLINPICEHRAWKINYSTNKVQLSYAAELPQSNFPDYTNSPTFPDFGSLPWHQPNSLTFPGFQKSDNPVR